MSAIYESAIMTTLYPTLSESEEKALEEMRCNMADTLSEERSLDETYLLRWLIARDFNVKKASAMLINSLNWRKENNIDNILKWVPPPEMLNACPYNIDGKDNNGRPVLCFPYGKWTPWDFTDVGRRDEYSKYVYQMLEKCIAEIKPPVTQFVIIADSTGFSFRHMTRFKAIEANLDVLRVFEANYPEYMQSAFVINAPSVFSALFSLIKPLMSSRTQSKLHVSNSNTEKWKSLLAEHIPQHQLPVEYRIPNKDGRTVHQDMVDLDFSSQSIYPVDTA